MTRLLLAIILAASSSAADAIPTTRTALGEHPVSENLLPLYSQSQEGGGYLGAEVHGDTAIAGGASASAGAPVSEPAQIGSALMGGFISWADPELGGDYLATRFPVGTFVKVCARRCIFRVTTDFGPSAAIDPPRIADLAVLDWESICGLPRARGVCKGTVETVDVRLPPTDTSSDFRRPLRVKP